MVLAKGAAMKNKASTPIRKSVVKKTKIEIIQDIYGKDKTSATLGDTSKYLEEIGFKSLSDLLHPIK